MNPRRLLLLVSCLALVALSAAAQSADDASEGRIVVTLTPPEQADAGHPVEMHFDGRVRPTPLWIEGPEAVVPPPGSADAFVASVLGTNRDGEVDAVVALWHPDERDAMRTALTDSDAFQQNRLKYRAIHASGIRAHVRYGRFTLVFVLHQGEGLSDLIMVYPLVPLADGAWALSNALRRDPAFRFFVKVYRDRLLAEGAGSSSNDQDGDPR